MSNVQLEELFGQAANRAGSIENLLDEFFGFLKRRTDFYIEIDQNDMQQAVNSQFKMGFPKGRAEQIVLRSFKKHPFKSYRQVVEQIQDEQVIPKSPASAAAINAQSKTASPMKKENNESVLPRSPEATTSTSSLLCLLFQRHHLLCLLRK